MGRSGLDLFTLSFSGLDPNGHNRCAQAGTTTSFNATKQNLPG